MPCSCVNNQPTSDRLFVYGTPRLPHAAPWFADTRGFKRIASDD